MTLTWPARPELTHDPLIEALADVVTALAREGSAPLPEIAGLPPLSVVRALYRHAVELGPWFPLVHVHQEHLLGGPVPASALGLAAGGWLFIEGPDASSLACPLLKSAAARQVSVIWQQTGPPRPPPPRCTWTRCTASPPIRRWRACAPRFVRTAGRRGQFTSPARRAPARSAWRAGRTRRWMISRSPGFAPARASSTRASGRSSRSPLSCTPTSARSWPGWRAPQSLPSRCAAGPRGRLARATRPCEGSWATAQRSHRC